MSQIFGLRTLWKTIFVSSLLSRMGGNAWQPPLGGSSLQPDFQPFGGESRFAYLPEWWVQGLVNGIERHLCPAGRTGNQLYRWSSIFIFQVERKERLRQWQDEVQDAKFRLSRSCLVRECPKLRTLPPPSINAGALNLCAMGRRVYLIQFVICFFRTP